MSKQISQDYMAERLDGRWKIVERHAGITQEQAKRLVRDWQAPCTHTGPCRYPFRNCDGGQLAILYHPLGEKIS